MARSKKIISLALACPSRAALKLDPPCGKTSHLTISVNQFLSVTA
jgi:hypothetical protein